MPVLATPPPIRWLLVALVVIAQVPAVIAMAALGWAQYERQREAVSDDMVERARVLAVAVRERLEKAQAALDSLEAKVPADPAQLRAFHQAATEAAGAAGLDVISLVEASGQQLVNTRVPWGTALPRSPPSVLDPFSNGRRTVVGVSRGAMTGRPFAGLAVPVVRDSRIRWVLSAGLEATRFRDLIVAQQLPPGWAGTIVDAEGRIVARVPGYEDYVGRYVDGDAQERIVEAAKGITPMTIVFDAHALDGSELVTAMRRSPVNGWTVSVSVPGRILNAPVWHGLAWDAALLVTISAISIALALSISSRIARCIGALRDAAAALPGDRPLQIGAACFAEAQQVGHTLMDAQSQILAGRAELERVTHRFNQALMREIESRQRNIARELHDSVGSSLAGVSLLLGNACTKASDARLSVLLHKAHEQVTRSAQQVREISRGMTPAGTEAGGLLPAIEQFAADVTQYQGVECTVRWRGEFSRVPSETGTHLYRIVQEAATNAIRHGDATHVHITLIEHRGACRLSISDDGAGFEPGELPESRDGIGLRSMQARARAIDGRLVLRARRGGGCRVRVIWRNAP